MTNANLSTIVSNALAHYYEGVQAASRFALARRDPAASTAVSFTLPKRDEDLIRFTNVSDLALTAIDSDMYLLDLMRNPGTRTTKTLASLTMVIRAVDHIRRTGERLILLTATSGNKGNALRDAIARAYATGFARPEELRVVVVVPTSSREKLRACGLSADPLVRAANPVVLAAVDQPAGVKELARVVVDEYADALFSTTGFRCWYTLDLDNYRVADSVRAFAEADLLPIEDSSPPRWHAHAVSSAYGLLGYHLGHQVMREGLYPGSSTPAWHPGFFLVQHLATPDMVNSVLDRKTPHYVRNNETGLWWQTDDAAFPACSDSPDEVLDPTFYTKAPPTSLQIDPLIAAHGGGGVVVSKRECLDRFDRARELAANAGVVIDPDPATVREWSLIKVLVGVLIARERDLIPRGTQMVVHGSGYYTDALIPMLAANDTRLVSTPKELAQILAGAAGV